MLSEIKKLKSSLCLKNPRIRKKLYLIESCFWFIKYHYKNDEFFAHFSVLDFGILCQEIANDKTLIIEKFYVEHTIGFGDIKNQSGHPLPPTNNKKE
jgi:hypothetical protein